MQRAAVPTHFTRLLKFPEEIHSSFSGANLQYVMHTDAPCPLGVKQLMINSWGPMLMELRDASGAGGVATIVDSHESLQKPGTVGEPTMVAELMIISDGGEQLGPNEVGQIYVKSLMSDIPAISASGVPLSGTVSALIARLGEMVCPGSDSNRHLTVFETVASANWATGALCDGETSGLTRR